jgi:hypothetical protein
LNVLFGPATFDGQGARGEEPDAAGVRDLDVVDLGPQGCGDRADGGDGVDAQAWGDHVGAAAPGVAEQARGEEEHAAVGIDLIQVQVAVGAEEVHRAGGGRLQEAR